jgi:hypothetical protein
MYFQTAAEETPLVLDRGGVPYLAAGAWGYVAAGNRQLLLSDYEAQVGYFLFVYRRRDNASGWRGLNCRDRADQATSRRPHPIGPPAVDGFVFWVDRYHAEAAACIRAAMGNPQRERVTAHGTLLSFSSAP